VDLRSRSKVHGIVGVVPCEESEDRRWILPSPGLSELKNFRFQRGAPNQKKEEHVRHPASVYPRNTNKSALEITSKL